jgi:type IV pilus assembly protein PilW
MNFPRQAAGLTLVEMMVAITIALIILAAVATLFITTRTTYKFQEGMARVQESGRFAIEFIANDVRMAGYTGCIKKSATIKNDVNDAYATDYRLGNYLVGYTYTGTGTSNSTDWTPPLPSDLNTNEVVPYTDVITIRRSSDDTVPLSAKMSPDNTGDVVINGNPLGLNKYDIVIVADCNHADMFQITAPDSLSGSADNNLKHDTGDGTPGNQVQPLSTAYGTNAQLMKLDTRIYYIGRRGGNAMDTTKPPALFRKVLSGGGFATQELVQGVENMKVVLGVDRDSDGTADGYYRASTLTASDLKQVVSARIGLLVQTTENADTTLDTKSYNVAGFTVTPSPDRRRRHVYTTTVQLRNP